ncbi:hypothetical protein RUM44_004592 [Polyplax serrata]|uniref:Uncharacterized protein n=1 Tax=Polyplax serrata TaxID=468196 RepID=A0ABR1B398_POLSC
MVAAGGGGGVNLISGVQIGPSRPFATLNLFGPRPTGSFRSVDDRRGSPRHGKVERSHRENRSPKLRTECSRDERTGDEGSVKGSRKCEFSEKESFQKNAGRERL